jgi:hypothetical protein
MNSVHVFAAAGPALLEAFHSTQQSAQAVFADNGSCKGWCDGIHQPRMNELSMNALLSIGPPGSDTT